MRSLCTTTVEDPPVGSDIRGETRDLTTDNFGEGSFPVTPGFSSLFMPLVRRTQASGMRVTTAEAAPVDGFEVTRTDLRALEEKLMAAHGLEKSVRVSDASIIETGAAGYGEAAAVAEAAATADEAFYEEVNLQDLEFDALEQQFLYPCPCGDLFELTLKDLRASAAAAGENRGFALASCPSCSLKIRVLFDRTQLRNVEKELSLSICTGEA